MDDIQNTPGWGIPENFNDMLNNRSGNQRTSYDEMQDVLDDLADDMSMAVDQSKWTGLLSGYIVSLVNATLLLIE